MVNLNENLPLEILAKIFYFVMLSDVKTFCQVVPFVCRKWKRVVQDLTVLDTSKHVGIYKKHKLTCSLVTLMDRFPSLKSLNASVLTFTTPTCFHRIGPCHHQPFLKLVYLAVEECYALDDEGLMCLSANCPNIISLSVAGCNRITDVGMTAVAVACMKLQYLDISNCSYITDVTTGAMAKRTFAFHSLCRPFKGINVERCRHITDIGVRTIVTTCKYITHLRVGYAQRITDDSLFIIGKHCINLLHIGLCECQNISSDGFRDLCMGCPNLETIVISDCYGLNDACMSYIARFCKKLKHLSVTFAEGVGPTGIGAVAKGCKNLTKLMLCTCYVTDDALEYIGTHCNHLTELDIAGSHFITDSGLSHIAPEKHDGKATTGLARLRKLNVTECYNLTDTSVLYVLAKCTELQEVTFKSCFKLTNQVAHAILKHCERMRHVNFKKCVLVTNKNLLEQIRRKCGTCIF